MPKELACSIHITDSSLLKYEFRIFRTTSNYADESQSSDFHEMVEEHLEQHRERSEECDQASSSSTSSTRKRKADEIDNKMSTLLDKYIANASDGRHTAFAQLIDKKLSSLPLELAERCEAQILNIIYSAAEKYHTESRPTNE